VPPIHNDENRFPAGLEPARATESPATSPRIDITDLKHRSVRGGAVTLVTQAISIAIQLTSTVVLARLLSPDDYGTMAMVVAVTGFAGLFRDLGLSSAAVQAQELSHPLQSNLFWLNVTMGALLTGLVAAGSPLVAWFYGKPILTLVTLALSINFLISSLSTQHGARLVRNMQFARQACASIVGAVVTLLVSVTFALHGYSYWSLVWGYLSGTLTTTLLLFALSPFLPCLPSKETGIRQILKFGANVTAFDFVNYFHRNLDNILIGRHWGPGPLGLYSRAYQLLMFPINAIRGPINTVAFPALSKLQNHPTSYRAYYHKVIALLAFASMPLTAFLFCASGDIIRLTLGHEWAGVSPIFSALAAVGFIQPPLSLIGTVLLSSGKTTRYLQFGIYNAVIVSIAFVIGVNWGPVGVAISYAIAHYLSAYPFLVWSFSGTHVKPLDFCAAIIKPACASLLATVVILVASIVISTGSVWIELAWKASLFGTFYLLAFSLLPKGAAEIRDYFQMLLILR